MAVRRSRAVWLACCLELLGASLLAACSFAAPSPPATRDGRELSVQTLSNLPEPPTGSSALPLAVSAACLTGLAVTLALPVAKRGRVSGAVRLLRKIYDHAIWSDASVPEAKPAILYIGPSVCWQQYLEAIRQEGLLAVACIAEDYHDSPICTFLPFSKLKEPGGAQELGFEALIINREPYRIVEQARALEGTLNLRFVGLLRTHEPDTAVVDFVAAAMGLPHNSLTTVLARRDKVAMKEALRSAGLAHASFARVCGVEQMAAAVERTGLPVVVKPPSCASSSDVRVCADLQQAEGHAAKVLGRVGPWGDLPAYVVAEEYLEGKEYAVNAFLDGSGKAAVTDVWAYDKETTGEGEVLYRSVSSLDPASLPEVCSYALDVCRAVGIVIEAAHVEVKVTKTGPVMVEVGARRPGGLKTELLARMVPAWDPFRSQVRTACGWPITFPQRFMPEVHARHIFFHFSQDGALEAVAGEAEVRALGSFHALKLNAQLGDTVQQSTDIVSCAAFLWLVSKDTCQLDKDEAAARALLKFTVVACAA